MRFVALLMTVVCAVPSLVSAQDDSDRATQSRIVALEKAWNQAYKLADRKALNELLDDQLVLVNVMAASRTKASFWPAMQRPLSECLERRELRAANPILRGNAFLTLGSTRTESGDVRRRLQSLSRTKFRLCPLGAGVSTSEGRSRLHRQLQLMSFQYGNLGPHGQ
jgi:hypothetical protein